MVWNVTLISFTRNDRFQTEKSITNNALTRVKNAKTQLPQNS